MLCVKSTATIFKFPFDTSGIIPPGETKEFTIECFNTIKVRNVKAFHWYFVFVESDALPDDFLPEKEEPPKKIDADHLQLLQVFVGIKIMTPKLPPELVMMSRHRKGRIGGVETRRYQRYTIPKGILYIWNKSPTKFLAYRENRRSHLHVFYAFMDTKHPPERLHPKSTALPNDHPAYPLEITIPKEKGAPKESQEPLSQTGAPLTEADAPAPDAPPGASPGLSSGPTSGTCAETGTGTTPGAASAPGASPNVA
ncbi:hypothetical protein PENTCL1PPCAC_15896 [Pristionchus entomophagus]|uniref:Major sperm protein n=1 Tax=Pristionchus entomophagus TaxID=358040 RepID=A0AAV5THC2_9BILA|nr:hypothetical protein PENTCL1PPCAC_15896 [Pristionchus entomophagus]